MVSVTSTAWAILCGLTLGVGLWTLASATPKLTRPRLAHRVAPYLTDVSPGARTFVERRQSSPLPVFGALLGPGVERFRSLVGPLIGNTAILELRLRQADSRDTVPSFRSRLLVWTIVGTAAGVVASIAVGQIRSLPIALHVVLIVAFGAGGYVACDQRLAAAARSRVKRMTSELPVILEFLTLSLSAGEGVLDSFRRISTTSNGELASELGRVVSAVNSGSAVAASLHECARGIQMPEFTRCVDQIVGALERGTPLADVLRAQSQDAREESKRELLEVAGKKEVAMMIPVNREIEPFTSGFCERLVTWTN